MVAGDTGNDSAMFLIPGVRGIIVENAQPELFARTLALPTYQAQEHFADGVLEGLQHYGVVGEIPDYFDEEVPERMDPAIRRIFDEEHVDGLTDEDIELLETAYAKALEALKRNITPMGFSACSLRTTRSAGPMRTTAASGPATARSRWSARCIWTTRRSGSARRTWRRCSRI